jgi:hypothetical protein
MSSVLSLTINTLGFCSNLYALKGIHDPTFSNPYALGFGGQFQVRKKKSNEIIS